MNKKQLLLAGFLFFGLMQQNILKAACSDDYQLRQIRYKLGDFDSKLDRAFTQKKEIDRARKAFFQCYSDNNGLNVDRMTNGLPRKCLNDAMAWVKLGYANEVNATIEFFNKLRE
ncbi:MAG: hypothetical protein WC747_01810 [Candidatus Babeliales bacterium]|jgi:hypothetical protein